MKTLLVTGLIATMTFACAVDGSSTSSTASLVEQCSGTYDCGGFGHPELHKVGDTCMLDSNYTLAADGTILIDNQLSNETWSGNAQSFQWCNPNRCATCIAATTNTDSGTGTNRCTGSTYGCEEQSPPNCSAVRGCYMATRIGPNNAFENYCTGYPDSCSEMATQSDCSAQGCTWH